MESLPLVLTDPNMLAEFVRQSQLKTFFEKRFAAPADLGAVLFRDGAVIDGFKGTQFSIGGLWENLKGVIGGSHHYEILLADLKPFQAVIPVKGMSKDQIEIVGEATFEMQLNPEKVASVLGLMRGITRNEKDGEAKGMDGQPTRKALLVADVVARLEPHFRERVFGAVLMRHNAEELRGSRGMQDQIQADLMKEAERLFGDTGVLVRNATVNFAMNEAERQAFELARVQRDEAMKDHQLDLLKRQVTREADSTSFQITTKTDVAKVQRSNEDELRHMLLNSEVDFVDAREAHKRRQEFEALDHEARLLVAENAAKAEISLTGIGDATTQAKARLLLSTAEKDIEGFERGFGRQQTLLDAELAAQLAEIGLGTRKGDHGQNVVEATDWARIARENADAATRDEIAKAKGLAEAGTIAVQADFAGKVAMMNAAQTLSAEQLRELMPGLSEDAANVAVARAQADGMNSEQMIAFAKETYADTREQEHRMFETGMKGGTGMAAGLGGTGKVPASMGGGGDVPDIVECPNCKTENLAKAKFCKTCGTQLRN